MDYRTLFSEKLAMRLFSWLMMQNRDKGFGMRVRTISTPSTQIFAIFLANFERSILSHLSNHHHREFLADIFNRFRTPPGLIWVHQAALSYEQLQVQYYLSDTVTAPFSSFGLHAERKNLASLAAELPEDYNLESIRSKIKFFNLFIEHWAEKRPKPNWWCYPARSHLFPRYGHHLFNNCQSCFIPIFNASLFYFSSYTQSYFFFVSSFILFLFLISFSPAPFSSSQPTQEGVGLENYPWLFPTPKQELHCHGKFSSGKSSS